MRRKVAERLPRDEMPLMRLQKGEWDAGNNRVDARKLQPREILADVQDVPVHDMKPRIADFPKRRNEARVHFYRDELAVARHVLQQTPRDDAVPRPIFDDARAGMMREFFQNLLHDEIRTRRERADFIIIECRFEEMNF